MSHDEFLREFVLTSCSIIHKFQDIQASDLCSGQNGSSFNVGVIYRHLNAQLENKII